MEDGDRHLVEISGSTGISGTPEPLRRSRRRRLDLILAVMAVIGIACPFTFIS